MKSEAVVGVQPKVFLWARESLGLSLADVASMMKRSEEEVASWESGDGTPTYPQLEKLAYQIYKRPVAVFFLPAPPDEILPQREFRTLPDAEMGRLLRDTYLQIRHAHAYQLALSELFEGKNPLERKIWKSVSLTPEISVSNQVAQIREYLSIPLETQISWRSEEQALKEWRKAIEESGIFVFKAAFKQKDISGFCLFDDQLPVIYLNNSTTKTRQTFSLMHELAHILLGINGLSKFDASYVQHLPTREKAIEQFCNAIAAEMLMPEADFAAYAKGFPANVEAASEEHFSAFASRYHVSREVILRRFRDQGRVSKSFYENKARLWAGQKTQTCGGNWYANQGAYISSRFAKEVVSRHYKHQISLEQAAGFLGIKPKSYPGFEEHMLRGVEV